MKTLMEFNMMSSDRIEQAFEYLIEQGLVVKTYRRSGPSRILVYKPTRKEFKVRRKATPVVVTGTLEEAIRQFDEINTIPRYNSFGELMR